MADFFGNRWQVNAVLLPTPIGSGEAYLQPVGEVMKLFSHHIGTRSVELEAIEKGDIFLSTIVQSPTDMGKLAVQIAVAAAKGEEITEKEVATELTLVNKDNIAEFYEAYNANQAALEPYKS